VRNHHDFPLKTVREKDMIFNEKTFTNLFLMSFWLIGREDGQPQLLVIIPELNACCMLFCSIDKKMASLSR
jgi:hypothetical protein